MFNNWKRDGFPRDDSLESHSGILYPLCHLDCILKKVENNNY